MIKIGNLLIIIAVVIVAGAVGLATTGTWPFEKVGKPGVVEEAIENLSSLESTSYQLDFTVAAEGKEEDKETLVSFNLTGSTDRRDPEKPRSSLHFQFNFSTGTEEEGMSFAASVVSMGTKELYLKAEELPELPIPFLDQELYKSLEGQWIKIDEEQLREITGIEEPLQQLEQQKEVLREVKAIFSEKKFFDIKEELPEKEISGDLCIGYLTELNKESLKEVLIEYLDLAISLLPDYQLEAGEDEIEKAKQEIPQSIDEFWEKIGGIELEAWVTKEGSLLKQVKFEREITGQEMGNMDMAGGLTGQVEISITLEFFDFNKEFDIEAPQDAKTLEEVITSIMESGSFYLDTSMGQAQDARIISALSQARTVMVYLYANEGDYDNLDCLQEDMVLLCEEVEGQGSRLNIARDASSDSQAVCLWVKLTSAGSWFCADSSGESGWTTVNPNQTGYCSDSKSAVCPPVSVSAP